MPRQINRACQKALDTAKITQSETSKEFQKSIGINSTNEDKKNAVVSEIKSVLNEKSSFDNINILFDKIETHDFKKYYNLL